MKVTYDIREENGVFNVYKGVELIESFPTRKEAEDYVKLKERKTNILEPEYER